MRRRDLFKMLATLAAVPFFAPLAALCKGEGQITPFVASTEELKRLNANDDLFGYPGQFHVCHEEAVNLGRRDYASGARGEMSTLTSERGVPVGLTVEEMRPYGLFYRRAPLSIGTEVPRDFYARSMEPSEGEQRTHWQVRVECHGETS